MHTTPAAGQTPAQATATAAASRPASPGTPAGPSSPKATRGPGTAPAAPGNQPPGATAGAPDRPAEATAGAAANAPGRGPAAPNPRPGSRGTLARRAAVRSAPPGRTDPRRPAAGALRGGSGRALPPHLWFAQHLLDVLTGRRPLTALAGRVRDEAYQRLWQLHADRADWRLQARGRTPSVRRCRVFRTESGALEVTAVVVLDEGVVRAIAFRLEPGNADSGPGYGRARWHCTDVAAS
ncbi:Rv3235 family protein [Actinacidiphila guanduensis]|uniref:Uncharacterized protein n=1 Tax=Actinacidiphila guanduensis TaxID=310781 RepID=A0A1H0G781_9ACTN|nr:Rv3235 family protein [Actinacidiphila guanduensis]SDO02710.1 hypothetical protein SAMN05216259_10714 [Actinacidiphila guanduensis]